ncbi:MAG: LamG domain-containing protein, partial [Planctomycetes bacterium]|nr:LamG domain-containing protein [Planctomycetota bacterium]
MCKKSIYLTLIFFVFGLTWTGPANAADPSLQLWLELEDNANDSSNYARPTTVTGTLDYGPGVIGQGADFGGNANYVTIADWKGILGESAFTVSAWCLPDVGNNGHFAAWGAHHTGADANNIQFRSNNDRLRVEHGSGDLQGDTVWNQDGEWHHVAVTHAAGATLQHPGTKLYLDGWDDTRLTSGDGSTTNIQAEFDVRIGIRHSAIARNLNSWFDDVRIYDRELSATEIRVLAGAVEPFLLEPADGAVLKEPSALLKWLPGVYAADVNGHEVYLGDNFEDVNAGTGGTLKGATSAEFFHVSGLDLGKVYYWRVNAVNDLHPDTPWESEIWSFAVPKTTAWAPVPADKAEFISTSVTLEWQPGLDVVLHVPYFGTSFEDVNTATGGDQQPGTTYTPPGPLANDTFYFWRVDTYNGATTVKGPVWQFKTEPFIPIADPNLIGWWKLDGLDPTRAIDWSGHNNHGYLRGDPQWVPGYDANALEFDGTGDWVAIDNLYYDSTGHPEVTVWAWIRTSDSGNQAIASFDRDSYWRLEINGNGGGAGQVGWSVFTDAGQIDMGSSARVDDGDWHHVVGVYDNGWAGIFIDGRVDAQTVSGTTFGHGRTRYGFIGSRSEAGAFDGGTGTPDPFAGTLDDVRIYDRALSDDEVLHLIAPEKAYKARPADGEMDVPLSAKLTWSPGTDEITGNPYTKHDVYFNENFEDVNSGTVATATVTDVNEYTPTALDYYKYYYWRIDGVNAADEPVRGFIWSFKATYNPALVVDPNLLAWYKFDGDATDSSGYGRDLTEFGNPVYAAGFEDQAIDLNGVADYAVYSFPSTTMTKYTVMMWVKTDNLMQDQYSSPFSSHTPNNEGFQIDVDNSDPRYYRYHDGFDSLFGPVTTGWVHLAVACDGARTSLFFNGSFVDVNTAPDLIFNEYAIGINRNAENWFEGAVDEVRVYDYELPDEEIVAVMRIDQARAWMPNPGDGASGVELEPTL